MKYKVIRDFSDYTDNKYIYRVGDEFPRSGLSVSEDRISQLLGNGNKQGVPLIVERVSLPSKGVLDSQTEVDPPIKSEAKRRPRKRQEKHARTDS